MPIVRTPPQDVPDLGLKTDVEHPVRFIKNHDAEVVENQVTTVIEILDSTGSAHGHLDPAFELSDLAIHVPLADETGNSDRRGVCQSFGLAFDLVGQFTSGSQDQRLGDAQIVIDCFQDGQHERSRLAGTGMRLAGTISTGECLGDKGPLNGTGILESHVIQRTQ